MRPLFCFRLACFIALTTAMATPSLTGASVGKISGPEVSHRQAQAKYLSTHTHDDQPANDGNDTYRLELEYGFAENWAAEIGLRFDDRYREDFDFTASYVEMIHTLTRQKQGWWLSSALVGEYVLGTDGGSDEVEAQLRLQRDEKQFRLRFNTSFEREVGGGASRDVFVGTRASAMLKAHANINPVIEWHADWGTTSQFYDSEDQGHWAGPAVYGDLWQLPDGSAVTYQVGYLFGITRAAEDGVARFVLEYKREF